VMLYFCTPLSVFIAQFCYSVVAKVTVPYTAVKDNQLSLEQGQLIHVLEQDSSGWWKGQLHVSKLCGFYSSQMSLLHVVLIQYVLY